MKQKVRPEDRRDLPRRGGIAAGWAIFVLPNGKELRCWVQDESAAGVGLETADALRPCPLEAGQTYWLRLKPSAARKVSWVAATVKHVRRKGQSDIYKVGIRLSSNPPAGLGEAPSL